MTDTERRKIAPLINEFVELKKDVFFAQGRSRDINMI